MDSTIVRSMNGRICDHMVVYFGEEPVMTKCFNDQKPFTHWAKCGHSITVFVYLIYIVILFCLFCFLLLFVCLFVIFCFFFGWCFFDCVVVYCSICLYCYHFNIFCRLSRSPQCQWEFPRRIYFVLLLELLVEILIKCTGFIKYFIYY